MWVIAGFVSASVVLAGGADLTVLIQGAQSDAGTVAVTLFDRAEGFPMDASKAQRVQWAKLTERQAKVLFAELAPGTYAVAVFHDQNGNRKLDTNFLGIPSEPAAASRQAKGKMGPPKFADAAITLGQGPLSIVINLPID